MHFVKYRQYSHIENNKQVSPVHLGMNLGKSNVSNRKGSAWLPAEKAKIHRMSLEAEQVTGLFGIPKGFVNYSGLNANMEEDYCFFEYQFVIDDKQYTYSFSLNAKRFFISEKLKSGDSVVFNLNTTALKKADATTGIDVVVNADDTSQAFLVSGTFKKPYSVSMLNFLSSRVGFPENHPISRVSREISGYEFCNFSNLVKESLPNVNDISKDQIDRLRKFLAEIEFNIPIIIGEQLDGSQELYFQYKRPIKFLENASSGAIALVKLFFKLENEKNI